jgi:hypothetical protein
MDLRPIFLAVAAGVCALSCGESRASEEDLLARSPGGSITEDGESDGRFSGIDLPEFLRPSADLIGRGVCVTVGTPRSDGSYLADRTGEWTYEYMRTTKTLDAEGKTHTHFEDLETSSLGIEARGSYAHNRAEGEWTFWYPNKKKRAVGHFTAGEMSGPWKFWLEDGKPDPKHTGTYDHGVLVEERR